MQLASPLTPQAYEAVQPLRYLMRVDFDPVKEAAKQALTELGKHLLVACGTGNIVCWYTFTITDYLKLFLVIVLSVIILDALGDGVYL